MIIDSHLHVWSNNVDKFPFQRGGKPSQDASAEFLLKTMDDAGVDRAVIVQPRNYMYDNRYVAETLKRYPDKFAGVALVDVKSPNAPDTLEDLVRNHGFGGFRLQMSWETNPLDVAGKDRNALWSKAEELGVTIIVLGSGLDHSALEPIIERFPKVPVVLDHIGGVPIDEEEDQMLRASMLRLARFPNVHVKISGMFGKSKQHYPYHDTWGLVKQTYNAYGPERLMWGSDFPGILGRCTYQQGLDLVGKEMNFLNDDDRAWLFEKTVSKLWKFGGSGQ
ncbi:MAG: amidohydrolase family protein [Chloroflexi bacterium]|nr:amidohydrolase family protein [Chloroflexota bacterium]